MKSSLRDKERGLARAKVAMSRHVDKAADTEEEVSTLKSKLKVTEQKIVQQRDEISQMKRLLAQAKADAANLRQSQHKRQQRASDEMRNVLDDAQRREIERTKHRNCILE